MNSVVLHHRAMIQSPYTFSICQVHCSVLEPTVIFFHTYTSGFRVPYWTDFKIYQIKISGVKIQNWLGKKEVYNLKTNPPSG